MNDNNDLNAYNRAKQDLGGKLIKNANPTLDIRKSTKQSVYYEDGDGVFEIAWKKLMRLLSLED